MFHSLLIKDICFAWLFTEELTCSLFTTCIPSFRNSPLFSTGKAQASLESSTFFALAQIVFWSWYWKQWLFKRNSTCREDKASFFFLFNKKKKRKSLLFWCSYCIFFLLTLLPIFFSPVFSKYQQFNCYLPGFDIY